MRKLLLVFFAVLAFTNIEAVQKKNDPLTPETKVLYLSGHGSDDAVKWDFFCNGGRNSGKWTKISVPSCWELQGFGTYQYGMSFYGKADPPGIAKEQGLYKYTFKLPKEWEGRVIKLVFEGVMTDCSVMINGRKAVKLHQGAFYRFKTDVSDRVFFGDNNNVLEVTVSKESENPQVNLAERRADYWNFGGIFRPVFIEALPVKNIDRVSLDAKADGSFRAHVLLGSAIDENSSVEAKITDLEGNQIGKTLIAKVPEGGDNVELSGIFPNVRTWTAETPNLYKVVFSLKQGDFVKHTVSERFAFRTIEVRPGEGLYINGHKILVKGINRHSFRPETGRTLCRKDNYDDVSLIKEMNMDAVRLSHYPPDPDFLEACDELGLYVIDELGGWHGKYDTDTGKKLVNEMVTRDCNHPSIIWWSNGNEGGWNTDLDCEFAKWDLQNRPVIHPQGNFGGFETMHYRSYGESQEYMRKPEIFMPTEFLHGLYDGGHGAGLYDYWEMMRKHPRCAGGFLWVFADEGVVRTDQEGRIDNVGNYAADGIVGPHHEKEGSFFTVRQIWSPVQITETAIPEDFQGKLNVENRYDFISLDKCHLEWELVRFVNPADKKSGHEVISKGEQKCPEIAPHASGTVQLKLPAGWKNADALMVTAFGPDGKSLWTWSFDCDASKDYFRIAEKSESNLKLDKSEDKYIVTAGKLKLGFSTKTGELTEVYRDGNKLSFGNGPRFIAARRGDRSMDVFYNHDDPQARSKERIYNDISGNSILKKFDAEQKDGDIVINAEYSGNMTSARWTITAQGKVTLDYEYDYEGVVELMGVKFDYPENQMISKRWLGKGPYRVWQNRLMGTTLDVWQTDYNDPIPGESFVYPEFKGYFNDWRWVDFTTSEGHFMMKNETPGSYLGVYTPRDGRDAILYTLPQSGIAVFKVIPAVRNKVNCTDLIGPSSQAKWVSGPQKGRIIFEF